MKYCLMIRSKPHDDMFEKHELFMSNLCRVGNEWGIKAKEVPELKDPGTLPMRQVKLSKYFAKGITGSVSYQNRQFYRDEAQYDDYFTMEFDPEKHDYKLLATECFGKYVQWFRAYRGDIGDEQFVHLDFEESRKIEERTDVYRIVPVSFFADELCLSAFGVTKEEVARRLSGHVDKVGLEGNGVIVVARSAPIVFEEAIKISENLKAMVRP